MQSRLIFWYYINHEVTNSDAETPPIITCDQTQVVLSVFDMNPSKTKQNVQYPSPHIYKRYVTKVFNQSILKLY